MLRAREYSATEFLRDGHTVEIRALKPEDRESLLAAVGRISHQSIYRRFFSFKRGFSEREVDFYVNVDFATHVALVAVVNEDGRSEIVGGARYIVLQSDRAEAAFTVDDAHQGNGIGTVLLRHLAAIASDAGLAELVAEVLPENTAMLKVFASSGREVRTRRELDATHVVLCLS